MPAFAGVERGILDLLAVDHTGRLAIVELKASADLQLPLQALDYWIRVKWHLDRGEFVLPDEAVRTAPDPEAALLAFLSSTYAAAADAAAWDRRALECA